MTTTFIPGKRMALVPMDSPSKARHADHGSGADCDMHEVCPVCWPRVYADSAPHRREDVAA